jgi:hypothetical protein
VGTPADSIVAYLRAKDGNRPHLMAQAFTETASLAMTVSAGAIDFPPAANGRDAITEILVRRFGQTYENVYTLCLASPPQDEEDAFSCDWLVAMSEKDSRAVRVGCGRYDWQFAPDSRLVERLSVTIETMQTLPPGDVDAVMDWVSALPWPWCPAARALRSAPGLRGLRVVLEYVGRRGA